MSCQLPSIFFYNRPATTAIYTLSLHDALPICQADPGAARSVCAEARGRVGVRGDRGHDRRHGGVGHGRDLLDRKSTRLNSSHQIISYAVFCLKKKNETQKTDVPSLLGYSGSAQ